MFLMVEINWQIFCCSFDDLIVSPIHVMKGGY